MKRRVILHIPSGLVSSPTISDLVRKYDITCNILRAQVMEDEEGMMMLELTAAKANLQEGIDSLMAMGIRVRELSRDIRRDEEICTHCGVCVGQCPTGALSVHADTCEVDFEPKKCILCELCVPACIYGAIKVTHESD